MADKQFRSPDKRIGVQITDAEMSRIIKQCGQAGRKETGGILVGRYTPNHDFAVVTAASNAPKDSRAGGTWFSRGVDGLQHWLNGLWKSKSYYLGEWHFHPFALATPSGDDVAEMKLIANTESSHCPEPILMIVGGNPNTDRHVKVFVYVVGEGLSELPEMRGDELGSLGGV